MRSLAWVVHDFSFSALIVCHYWIVRIIRYQPARDDKRLWGSRGWGRGEKQNSAWRVRFSLAAASPPMITIHNVIPHPGFLRDAGSPERALNNPKRVLWPGRIIWGESTTTCIAHSKETNYQGGDRTNCQATSNQQPATSNQQPATSNQ